MYQLSIDDFDQWRATARRLRRNGVPPADVQLLPRDQGGLFACSSLVNQLPAKENTAPFFVSKEFVRLAEEAGYHRDPERWNLLYRILWRLTTSEPQLLQIATDDDIHRLLRMERSVRRDAHKMKAFVRFREVKSDGEVYFVAWHRPDHLILRKVAPFFARRFQAMNWTILTPKESVTWNQQELNYGDGVDRNAAPTQDELEDLWRTYYAHIFNPARIKLKAMKAEMPVRHWSTLPETQAIEEMLHLAPQRVQAMLQQSEGFGQSATDYFPSSSSRQSWADLAAAAQQCRACDLYCQATQTVFGQGSQAARVVLVGEQPGDQEDRQGQPFVGPAGEVLNRAMTMAGMDRSTVYITNVVKHFRFESRGKHRLHKRPDARQIRACRPWFEAEWSLLNAAVLVCLGSTSATALIAPGFRIQSHRGQWVKSKYTPHTLATWHPSSILRLPDPEQQTARFAELVSDLERVQQMLIHMGPALAEPD